MNLLEIIILGIVEGLTEYLPVSSTGHLLLTESLLNMSQSKEALDALAVCIQGGAILAVLSLYFPRVKTMAQGVRGKNPAGLKLLVNIILAFLPAAVVGLCCASLIKEYLFNTYTVAYSWIVGGGVILAYCAWRAREGRSNEGTSGASIESLTPAKALTVGALQCVAMIPGTSRSLMTMLGGMFVGLSVEAAVEFSFLLGLITLGAATVHDAYKDGALMLESFGWEALAVGTAVSWLSAWLAVKWMVSYLQRHSFSIFGWYRIAIGIVTLVLLSMGLVH
ncbi:undecaprenyl-diphosphate phosphatase [uncultured Akkermansia sp.]|uniref:undecaprenyl-diphosphate phosphatase n=1 Tax=uncultured Akkermansia sp. TaxID=512294 RepID=UPI0026056189|nr:undecaprenyl-diphosphate phosphatase [uncultured Akkermansia sp.]